MMVRKHGFAALCVAAALVSGANLAWAQGPVIRPAAGAAASAPPAVAVAGVAEAPGGAVEPLFTPPAVLDHAWKCVMKAVVAGVKNLVDAEKIEASEALAPSAVATAPISQAPTSPIAPAQLLQRPPPARVVREAFSTSAVRPAPIPIEPPTEVGTDTRGEHAVLLGVRMELPWILP